jgi:hypothetical protein
MKSPKYGTPTGTFILWAGIIKPERASTAKHRMSPAKMKFSGGKAAAARPAYKRKHPITLPTQPFDWKDCD